jgi:hypothetical protein
MLRGPLQTLFLFSGSAFSPIPRRRLPSTLLCSGWWPVLTSRPLRR